MCSSDSDVSQPLENASHLSESAWKERLSPEEFHILRQAGTERPFGQIYEEFKKQPGGTYYCGGCGSPLFSSAHKFDSHCGWPSFFDAHSVASVDLVPDERHGMVRTEVVCKHCRGHLGHLFKGEGFDTPTNQRYCINGSVLRFIPYTE